MGEDLAGKKTTAPKKTTVKRKAAPKKQTAPEVEEKTLNYRSFYGEAFDPSKVCKGKVSDSQIIDYFRDTVYAAARRNSYRLSQVTLRLYSKKATQQKLKTKEAKRLIARTNAKYITTSTNIGEVTQHDSLTVLQKPNPFHTGRRYRVFRELYFQITGVNYDRLIRVDGTPVQLWTLPPHCVKVDRVDGLPVSYSYAGKVIDPADILVDAAEDLDNPYSHGAGTSPVRAIIDKLDLGDSVTEKLAALMNAPKFTGILSPRGEDQSLLDDQRERLERQVQRYRHDKQGGIMLADGDIRFEPVQQNATDLSAVEINRQIDELIARVFQIPLMILRGSEGASRASYEAAMMEWIEGGISSRLREIEDWLNYFYLPQFPDSEDYFYGFDDPSPLNELQDVQLYTLACGGPLLTVNEGRQELGWEKTEGADQIRDMQQDVADFTEEAATPEAAPEATATEQDIQTDPNLTFNGAQISSAVSIVQQVAGGLLPRDAGLGMLQVLVNLTPEQAASCMGTVGQGFVAGQPEAEAAPPEPQKSKAAQRGLARFKKILQKHFAKWRREVEGHLQKVGEQIEVKELPEGIQIKALPSEFIPSDQWSKDLATDSQPVIELFLQDEGKKLLTRVGASPDVFNVFNKEIPGEARKLALDFAQSTLDTTSKQINKALDETREALAEGLEAGDSIRDLGQRVGEIFDSLESSKAELIAITESSRAQHEGLRVSAKASGVVTEFEWLTTSDPCPECEDLNGSRISLDGDLPPLHPNCLCTLLEVLDVEQAEEGEE